MAESLNWAGIDKRKTSSCEKNDKLWKDPESLAGMSRKRKEGIG